MQVVNRELRIRRAGSGALILMLLGAAAGAAFAQEFLYDAPNVQILGEPLADSGSYQPSVVSRGDGQWFAWLQFVPGEGDHIWIAHRTEAGGDERGRVTSAAATYANPTLTVDATEQLWLSYEVWDANDERWDVVFRRHDQGHNFHLPMQINTGVGNAINHSVCAAPASGLWFAWQEDRDGQFDIMAKRVSPMAPLAFQFHPMPVISNAQWGDWRPAIQVTDNGSVCVAWDSYDGESYNVLARWLRDGRWQPIVDVATGPAFQARVSLAAAGSDSVWCTWEQGGENWGKDFRSIAGSHNNVNDDYGPLHRFRTLHMGQLVDDGRVLQLSDPLPLPTEPDARNRPNKRPDVELVGLYYERGELVVDEEARPWVFYRHFYAPWTGENRSCPHHIESGWRVYARRLDADGWSQLFALNLLQRDGMQELTLASAGEEIVVAWTVGRTDRRGPTNQRGVYVAAVPINGGGGGGGGGGGDSLGAPKPKKSAPRVKRKKSACAPVMQAGPMLQAAPISHAPKGNEGFEDSPYQLYFGDLHRHTDLSLCFNFYDGSLEDAYRSAIDAVGLDFFGVTDHSRDLDLGDALSHVWWRTIKAATRHRLRGTFFPYFSYERSNSNTDHNVISLRDDMLRSHTPALPNFWAIIDQDTFTIPHRTSNSGGGYTGRIWDYHDDEKRPLLEIFQGCRNLAAQGGAHNGLDRGYHLGFIASSDHMSNHTSYACVWAPEADREAIFRSMQARRTYAATDRIRLVFKSGDHWMGERITAASPVALLIDIAGTAVIDRIDLYRDGSILQTFNGGGETTFRATPNVVVPAVGEHYFYVHMTQADGHEAWSSPIWVTTP